MKLHLVRHGETIQNAQRIIQGQQPGELSPLGKLQSKRLADRLHALSFDYIYCSDLQRTRDTLAPFLERSEREVEYTHEIRERSFGQLEGLPGERYLEELERTGLSRIDYRPPDGENFYDLQERTDRFLNRIKDGHLGQSVMLMSHGGTIRAFLATLLNKSMDDLLRDDIQNTSLSIVDIFEDGTTRPQAINDHSHLRGLQAPAEHSSGIDVIKSSV